MTLRTMMKLQIATVMVLMMAGADCETGMEGGMGMPTPGAPAPMTPANNAPGQPTDAIVKTNILLDHTSRLVVGDDLVVYSYHYNEASIYYFSPSSSNANPANPPEFFVPGSDRLFNTFSFVVAGKKIVMVRSTRAVTIFDTETGDVTDIPESDIHLTNRNSLYNNSTAKTAGQMMTDGPYVATYNETSEAQVRVIDTSGAVPTVTRFKDPDGPFSPNQVAIDADAKIVVAADPNRIVYWNFDEPDLPNVIEGVSTRLETQMQIDGQWDYIQMSTGGEFRDFADPEGNTLSGSLMGTDVVCNERVVAFKALREFSDGDDCVPGAPDQFTVLSLIYLDRLN